MVFMRGELVGVLYQADGLFGGTGPVNKPQSAILLELNAGGILNMVGVG